VNSVLEFPDPKRRKQKSLGASEGAGSGHGRSRIRLRLSTFTVSAAIARSRFSSRFFDATRSGLAHRNMIAAIHKVPHNPSSFQTSYSTVRAETGNRVLMTLL
jgi:hypothetical protein